MLKPSESSNKMASWTVMRNGVVFGEDRHNVVEDILAIRAENEGDRWTSDR